MSLMMTMKKKSMVAVLVMTTTVMPALKRHLYHDTGHLSHYCCVFFLHVVDNIIVLVPIAGIFFGIVILRIAGVFSPHGFIVSADCRHLFLAL